MMSPSITDQRSWKSLFFDCQESASTGLYAANSVTVTVASPIGEVLTGGTSNAKIQCVVPNVSIEGYPTLIYRLLDGTITAGEVFTGAVGSYTLYGGGFDQLEVLRSDDNNIMVVGAVATQTNVFDFTSANGVGMSSAYRQGLTNHYLRDSWPTLGTKDFILQVVAVATAATNNLEFRIGTNASGTYILMTETNYRLGEGTGERLVNGAHLNDWSADSAVHTRAFCRRGMTISGVEETDGTDFVFRSSTTGEPWQTLTTNWDITLGEGLSLSNCGTTPANNHVYGVLLAVFDNGLPSDGAVLAGIKDHYTRWPTGDKKLTTSWGR